MKTWQLLVAAVLSLNVACSSSDDAEESQPQPKGSLALAFSVTNGVKVNPNLVDPLTGTIYGAVFLASEVTLTGPKDGVEEKASVQLDAVDLTTASVSADKWQSEPLPVDKYIFLGFMDLDGNGAETHEPDAGDPVTLPINDFDVVADQTVDITVQFDLVLD
jgi:hypothetical protein